MTPLFKPPLQQLTACLCGALPDLLGVGVARTTFLFAHVSFSTSKFATPQPLRACVRTNGRLERAESKIIQQLPRQSV
jgi:hypothetical protein